MRVGAWSTVGLGLAAARTPPPKGHLMPLGEHREPDAPMAVLDAVPTARRFWNDFIVPMKPVILRGAAKTWPAMTEWTDEYLQENYGHLKFKMERKNESMALAGLKPKDTLNTYFDETQDVAYVVSELPESMYKYIHVPRSHHCGPIKEELTEIDIWVSNGNTNSIIHKDAHNQLNCVINGTKVWTLFEPAQIRNMPFVREEAETAPIDMLAGACE
jgi:hypothetical protein